MPGIKRNLESKIDKLLRLFPIVIILGVRQGGKTTIAKRVRPEWNYFDLEKGSDYDRITSDFDFFFKENPSRVIIDEAQNSPSLFQELRGIVDGAPGEKNRFLLTGSSSFSLLKSVSESLAGRAAVVELGTLKMNEYFQRDLPPLYKIFQTGLTHETMDYLKGLEAGICHDDIMAFFLKGGYPEPALSRDPEFFSLWMENYFQAYIQRDIRKLFPRLNTINYRKLIAMLSSLTGTIVNRSELGRSLDTSEVTIKEYLDIAEGSFIWRNVLSYEKTASKSIVKMPKGIFRDTGLNHYLNGIDSVKKSQSSYFVGAAFESFVMEELIKGLEALNVTGWNYSYYRTRNGAEVDLILDGPFGVLPIEIKYGVRTERSRLASLTKFIKDNRAPFGLIINNGEKVGLISEKIIQVPAGLI
jgi:hypothetical protein